MPEVYPPTDDPEFIGFTNIFLILVTFYRLQKILCKKIDEDLKKVNLLEIETCNINLFKWNILGIRKHLEEISGYYRPIVFTVFIFEDLWKDLNRETIDSHNTDMVQRFNRASTDLQE